MRGKRFLALSLCLLLLTACTQTPVTPVDTPTPTPAPTPTPTPAASEYDQPHLTREEFPRLDGSTSTAPLARAVCAVLLGESREEVADLVDFSRTTQSYRNLMRGERDLLIAAEPALSVVEEAEKANFQWDLAPIATDALVFLVNEDNPVDDLTVEQVRKIYTGEITNWSEVGGEDREILPFQRNAEAGSQTLMQKLVMGELTMVEPPRDYVVASMAGLIEAVRSFDGSPGAIGYTVYYYANDMNMAEGLKVVSIDGAAPDAATIRSGDYPFTNPYYAAIAADAPEDSVEREVFDWLQGPVGQSLIQHEGYVSILDDPAPVDWDLGETEPVREVYTRLSPDPLPALIPSEDYGPLLPYVGDVLPSPNEFAWDIDKYGLVTREGMIVTDPVYTAAYLSQGYYTLTQMFESDDGEWVERCALAAEDGSWTTGFDYLYLQVVDEAHIWAVLTDGTGVMLDGRGEERWRLPLEDGEEDWLYQGGMNGATWWMEDVGICHGDPMRLITLDGEVTSAEGKNWLSPQGFYEGLASACVADANGKYSDRHGYINAAGEWVIEPKYDSCRDFQNGKAIAQLGEETVVLDKMGRERLRCADSLRHHISDAGEWFIRYRQSAGGVTNSGYRTPVIYEILEVYDETFTPVDCPMVGQQVRWAVNGYFWNTDGESVSLYTPEGSWKLETPGVVNGVSGDLVVLYQEEGDTTLWSVWTLDGTCLLPYQECYDAGVLSDRETGDFLLYTTRGDTSAIYDTQGSFLTNVTPAGWFVLSDGLLEVRSDLSYGYKDLEGNWVFRVSLMKSQGD